MFIIIIMRLSVTPIANKFPTASKLLGYTLNRNKFLDSVRLNTKFGQHIIFFFQQEDFLHSFYLQVCRVNRYRTDLIFTSRKIIFKKMHRYVYGFIFFSWVERARKKIYKNYIHYIYILYMKY